MFMDADTRDFEPQLVYGILGPILEDPTVRYVKAAYRRPFKSQETLQVDGGGRVTELSTKPLFNLFYPELTASCSPWPGSSWPTGSSSAPSRSSPATRWRRGS
jgi:glucosyl-3-phosphoglycerate synthase